MERRPGVGAVLRVLDEIADVIRCGLRQQIDDDVAKIGLHDRLLVSHLIERQRRREELRRGGFGRGRLRRRRFRALPGLSWYRTRASGGCALAGETRCRQQKSRRHIEKLACERIIIGRDGESIGGDCGRGDGGVRLREQREPGYRRPEGKADLKLGTTSGRTGGDGTTADVTGKLAPALAPAWTLIVLEPQAGGRSAGHEPRRPSWTRPATNFCRRFSSPRPASPCSSATAKTCSTTSASRMRPHRNPCSTSRRSPFGKYEHKFDSQGITT